VPKVHRSVITLGTLKSLMVRAASPLPVRGAIRSSRTASLVLVTICGVGSIPLTSSVFSCSTYSTMRLSCSASAFFSSAATSSIASFATYSTSASLIFIRKGDLPNPGCGPRFVHPSQELRFHLHQLLPPHLIRYVNHDAAPLYCRDPRGARQLRTDQDRPKLSQNFKIEVYVPSWIFSERGDDMT